MAGLTQPLAFREFMRSQPAAGFGVVAFLDALLIACFVALNASAFMLAPGTVIQLPSSRVAEPAGSGPLAVLTVDRNDLYFFEGRKLARNALSERLRAFVQSEHMRAGEGPVLLLKADATIPAASLFQIMDAAREAGFTRIHLAAELESSKGPWAESAPLQP